MRAFVVTISRSISGVPLMKKIFVAVVAFIAVIASALPAQAASVTWDDPNSDAQTRNSPPLRVKTTAEIKAFKVWTEGTRLYVRFYQSNLRWISGDRVYFTVETGSGRWRYSPQKGMVLPAATTSYCNRAARVAFNTTTDTVKFSIPRSCFLSGRNSFNVNTEVRDSTDGLGFDTTGLVSFKVR